LAAERIGVDFPAVNDQFERQSLSKFVRVSRRADTILCSTTRNLTIRYTSGNNVEIAPREKSVAQGKASKPR
jgi:hypothetical protein